MTTEAELLAQIYAHPLDDGPRLVYGDFLLQRGDPRGELIAMQLQHRDPERERALVEEHGASWVGGLARVLDLRPDSQTAFERGFLAIAELRRDSDAELAKVLTDPAWATVEEVRGWDPWTVLADVALPGLRRFEAGIDIDRLALLALRKTPLVNLHEALVVAYASWKPEQRKLLEDCKGLPALRELAVATHRPLSFDDLVWLLDTPVAKRIERLVVRRPLRPRVHDPEERDAIDRAVKQLARVRPTVPQLQLTTPASPIELRADGGGYVRAFN